MTECSRCGEYNFDYDRHTCPPLWLVWCPVLGEDREGADDVYARDAEEAVKRWGRARDEYGDYDIVRGAQYVVHVLQAGVAEKLRTFRIHAEAEPHYYATEIGEHQTTAVNE